ncbi:restriction endonuclease subunit S [Actinopolyspora sp. H202]|uniref:restriction endonuclease subunit S n=1 Tax=Actinopolyspora sp. H202 TaxID=1500456 RepID=UPI003EE547C1
MSYELVRLKHCATSPVVKGGGGKLPYTSLEDVESGSGKLLRSDLPLKDAEEEIQHRPGDVLFGKLRPYLSKSLMPTDVGVATNELMVLRPGENLDKRYLFYSSLSAPWVDWAVATSYGVRMPRTSWEAMGDYRMWLPPLEEQRRIADFLDREFPRIDSISRIRRSQLDLVVERFFSSVEERISKGFLRKVPLKYLAEITDTEHKTAPGVTGGGYWIAGTSAVRGGKIVHDQLYETDSESYAEWTKRRVPSVGDILLSREAPVGEIGYYSENDPAIAIGQRMVLISPDLRMVRSKYLAHVLLSRSISLFFELKTQGSLHPHLNMEDIKSIPVPWVTVNDQRLIEDDLENEIEVKNNAVSLCEQQLDLLAERKQALITAAVTGQLDVTTAGRATSDLRA